MKYGMNTVGTRGYFVIDAINKSKGSDSYAMLLKTQFSGLSLVPDNFGDPWNATLARIDKCFSILHSLGISVVRDWVWPLKWSTWGYGTGLLSVSENDGWGAIDRAVECAKYYSMDIILTLQCPAFLYFDQNLQNYIVPQAKFVANRYKNFSNVIIDPVNEINLVAKDENAGLVATTDEWAKYQVAVYNAVKSEAPNMICMLASVTHSNGCENSAAPGRLNTWGFLNSLQDLGYSDKFDEVSLHLYPLESEIIAIGYQAYSDAHTDISEYGKGTFNDIITTRSKLAAMGRGTVPVNVDEFGVFWGAAHQGSTELLASSRMAELLSICDSMGVPRCCYWSSAGSNRPGIDSINLNTPILNCFAQPGMGIFDEYDRFETKFEPYYVLQELNLKQGPLVLTQPTNVHKVSSTAGACTVNWDPITHPIELPVSYDVWVNDTKIDTVTDPTLTIMVDDTVTYNVQVVATDSNSGFSLFSDIFSFTHYEDVLYNFSFSYTGIDKAPIIKTDVDVHNTSSGSYILTGTSNSGTDYIELFINNSITPHIIVPEDGIWSITFPYLRFGINTVKLVARNIYTNQKYYLNTYITFVIKEALDVRYCTPYISVDNSIQRLKPKIVKDGKIYHIRTKTGCSPATFTVEGTGVSLLNSTLPFYPTYNTAVFTGTQNTLAVGSILFGIGGVASITGVGITGDVGVFSPIVPEQLISGNTYQDLIYNSSVSNKIGITMPDINGYKLVSTYSANSTAYSGFTKVFSGNYDFTFMVKMNKDYSGIEIFSIHTNNMSEYDTETNYNSTAKFRHYQKVNSAGTSLQSYALNDTPAYLTPTNTWSSSFNEPIFSYAGAWVTFRVVKNVDTYTFTITDYFGTFTITKVQTDLPVSRRSVYDRIVIGDLCSSYPKSVSDNLRPAYTDITIKGISIL